MSATIPSHLARESVGSDGSSLKQLNRLKGGGLIDRGHPLHFEFDGKPYSGFLGDTLASALLAGGVSLLGRSFKYHRPRGVLTAGSDEPNALVEVRKGARREPNSRVTVVELFDGMEAFSQNRWPSLQCDIGAINSLLAPLFVAGFYYKTFMWPASWWEKIYEPAIRRAAGLGRASLEPDPDSYEKAYAFCDLLVIGAGPAGLAAALAAGRSGARVIICDEDFLPGGRLNGDQHEIGEDSGSAWARRVGAELLSLPAVRLMCRTTVFGMYDGGLSGHRTFGAVERVSDHFPVPPPHTPRQRFWKLVAKRVILAAGAHERSIAFGGNDRPGIMMSSAVRTYVNRFAVAPGKQVAVFTTTDDGWKTAFDLAQAGISIRSVIDARRTVEAGLLERAKRTGAEIFCGAQVTAAHGGRRLHSIELLDGQERVLKQSVDVLAMSGGWNPNIALSTHIGMRPRWLDAISAFVPGDTPRGMAVVGAAAGSLSLKDALRQGWAAGVEAVDGTGAAAQFPSDWRADDEATTIAPLWFVSDSRGKAFVDFQHDVTQQDISLAAQEGFRSAELLKRYTTLGMATDQGKTSSLNGQALMATLTGRTVPEVGTTTYRPPYTPVAFGAIAGRHRGKRFRPTRLTPAHTWAAERGAKFVEVGQWLRAQWFAAPGERDWIVTASREARAVRANVGVCDVSTLGKIDISGPDVAEFLDRIYTNMISSLPVGKVRYGLMLREDGIVMDDGTAARFGPQHYVISTTTANAISVMQHLEHARQVLWPELDVRMISVTEQWAQFSIAGPNSRRLLEQLLDGSIDLSNASFPYLACAEFIWKGLTVRLFRISFSGELAYELAVPSRYGDAVIRAIMIAGEALNITPYGLEALNILRVEKGHITGNEINGTTTCHDLGLGQLMSPRKDFIGRVLAARPGLTDPERPTFVGIKPVNRSARLYAGAHLLSAGVDKTLSNDEGYVTSVAFSPMLGHWIGLSLLKRGPHRLGECIRAYDPVRQGDLQVEVVSPVFFDPEGDRLRA